MRKNNLKGYQLGLNRGNKLYEGHRMMLPEHKEQIISTKRKCYDNKGKQPAYQEDDEKNQVIQIAMETGNLVEICWYETINLIKLPAEEYAKYLHDSLNLANKNELKVQTKAGIVLAYFVGDKTLKCRFNTETKLIAIKDIVNVKLLTI